MEWIATLRNGMRYTAYGDTYELAWANAMTVRAKHGKGHHGYTPIYIELYR